MSNACLTPDISFLSMSEAIRLRATGCGELHRPGIESSPSDRLKDAQRRSARSRMRQVRVVIPAEPPWSIEICDAHRAPDDPGSDRGGPWDNLSDPGAGSATGLVRPTARQALRACRRPPTRCLQ